MKTSLAQCGRSCHSYPVHRSLSRRVEVRPSSAPSIDPSAAATDDGAAAPTDDDDDDDDDDAAGSLYPNDKIS